MKRVNELIAKEEMKEINILKNNLAEWVFTDWEYDTIERTWMINLVKELNSLNEEFKKPSGIDGGYFIYHVKHYFENVKELYRKDNQPKYEKVFKGWEILMDAYVR